MQIFSYKPATIFTEWYAELISLSLQAGAPHLVGEPHHHWDSWANNWTPNREWNRLTGSLK